MSVRAIQKDPNEKAGRKSYLGSAVIGGISGYALKWVLPITHQEKDKEFYAELKNISKEVFHARKKEIEEIRKISPKIAGQDKFINLYDSKKLNITEIKKLNFHISEKVMELFSRVNEKAEALKNMRKNNLIFSTKGIRPASVFVSAGICIGVLSAVIYNMIKYSPTKEKIE